MKFEVGSEYIVTKEMAARLDKDPSRFTRTSIPVGARLLVITSANERGRVEFSYEFQKYWTFQRNFAECTRKAGPEDGDTKSMPNGE
jgi:hypothetical protein